MKRDGGRAFPELCDSGYALAGMTMRQWYKGQAIIGLTSKYNINTSEGFQTVIEAAARIADLAIKEDEEHEEGNNAE